MRFVYAEAPMKSHRVPQKYPEIFGIAGTQQVMAKPDINLRRLLQWQTVNKVQ